MENINRVCDVIILTIVLFTCVSPAHSIPCSPRSPVSGSVACLDGAPGDNTIGSGLDLAFDLNSGNYFGFNDWRFLQLVGAPSDETEVDVGLTVSFRNPAMGSWSIFESTWENFDDLVVILKSDSTGEDMIYWSSYLFLGVDVIAGGSWFSGRPLSSFSIFGRAAIPIPEPASWSVVAVGLVVIMWAGKIRRKRIFPV